MTHSSFPYTFQIQWKGGAQGTQLPSLFKQKENSYFFWSHWFHEANTECIWENVCLQGVTQQPQLQEPGVHVQVVDLGSHTPILSVAPPRGG